MMMGTESMTDLSSAGALALLGNTLYSGTIYTTVLSEDLYEREIPIELVI